MEQLLTVKEAAALLSVSTKTLYAWAETGEIPSLKLIGARRFSPDAVQNWILSKQQGYNPTAKTVASKPKKGE